jgi:hypothetical protein
VAAARALVRRALESGWSEAVEREVDDYENYLAIQQERLEDMDPAHLAADAPQMLDGLGELLDIVSTLREAGESGVLARDGPSLLAAVDRAAERFS